MASSFDISALPEYVKTNTDTLLAKAVLGAKTASLINIQEGVKGNTKINLLTTSVLFGNGSACGFSKAGSSAFTQREIVPGLIKVNMTFCDKELVKTYASELVRIAAGQARLPFEEQIIADVVKNVQKANEVAIWQGKKDVSNTNENTNKFDGFLTILAGENSVVSVDYSDASATTATKKVNAMIASIPAEVASMDDVVIFCSPEFFNAYVQELVASNLFHYNPEDQANGEIKIPGFNLKLVSVGGLAGKEDTMVAGSLSNFYYGTDIAGDETAFDLWYSKDNQEYRLAINFSAGVQVAFPDQVVVGKA